LDDRQSLPWDELGKAFQGTSRPSILRWTGFSYFRFSGVEKGRDPVG